MFVKQGIQKTKIGVVTSDKMEKSRVVLVERLVKHPLYKKYIRRSSKFMAHDETNDTKMGDKVKIIESKPLSARKRWKIIEVLERAK
ncbi:30S ribosomal protein S17 [candidate division KSB1 bacterium]|nr:30S ribosomal protein S17 [candidate division KSB1 bacterium]